MKRPNKADDQSETHGHTGADRSPNLPPLREVIRAHDLTAKKSLGQNFILDLNLTCRIARIAAPLEGNTVIEVGPGPGGLTRGLIMEGAKKVIAIERDARCHAALRQIADAYPGRLEIHLSDALETDWPSVIADQPGDAIIVANLPYGIATNLLVGWLETHPWPPWFSAMALMFQKEVADRIVAQPGTKAYGRLSVLAQWRTIPQIALNLKPEAFTPPPKVSSAVVSFIPRPSPAPPASVTTLARVTAAAFGQRRKMLRQSLKSLTPMPELLLAKCNLDPTLRAENLTVQQFAELAAAFDDDEIGSR
ncbi:MAG: 16S rRNA (adenine(1518)-N(6)/adenine(1519)-N(6))-dimethyltransferase RsmA [Alphaproteobacteria bacterium]|nr:16S rRNA (adenine(1518)-N(6)/adenine(1519)-N(6))-dimethyltransferase RsmA [Alphaproteobacteria bacterium]